MTGQWGDQTGFILLAVTFDMAASDAKKAKYHDTTVKRISRKR